jgi:hypothetical protein|tara:strand:- start:208 stop:363 length:156 start_codon:yes stop_codon:yes gene_type:complete
MGFIKKRAYNGCELESPLYRKVAKEMAAKRGSYSTMGILINEYKKKRGKNK